ncbi:hypothetical protein LYZ37_08295 [Vibrio tubiashii]|nr:hypothetical protein [Vibrio tubiashii]WCP65890.1 hypothetical protein LYZ37_08295 [Vibrio tubiashii]
MTPKKADAESVTKFEYSALIAHNEMELNTQPLLHSLLVKETN